MEQYEIRMGDKPVGRATVERKGLYYEICCRCQLSGQVMCRVLVTCGDRQESLGVLVPVDGGFGLETRLAVRRLGEGTLQFRLLPRHGEIRGRFVPLAPEEPFGYISRLKDAFLENRNGVLGIVLKD